MTSPPPVMIEGEKEYKVEEIIDSRKRRGKLEYLVQWKGYTAEERTWEPAANVQNAPEKIDEYRKKYPDAIKHIRDMSRPQDLPGRHTAKLLFGWEDGKFEREYLAKLERAWAKWKHRGLLDRGGMEKEEDLMNVLAPERSEEEAETMTIKPRTTTEVVTRFLSRSERDP